MKLYCVYDLEQKKADALYTFENDVVAKRYFKATMQSPGLKSCAADFNMIAVGEFDEETLEYTPVENRLVFAGVDVEV